MTIRDEIDLDVLSTITGGNGPGQQCTMGDPQGRGPQSYWENSPPGGGTGNGPESPRRMPGRPTFDMRGNHPRPPGPTMTRSDRRLKRKIASL